FEDLPVTTDIFWCLCERLSYLYNDKRSNDEAKKIAILETNYLDALGETKRTNGVQTARGQSSASSLSSPRWADLDEELKSPIEVVEPQKTSKFSNTVRRNIKSAAANSSSSSSLPLRDDLIL